MSIKERIIAQRDRVAGLQEALGRIEDSGLVPEKTQELKQAAVEEHREDLEEAVAELQQAVAEELEAQRVVTEHRRSGDPEKLTGRDYQRRLLFQRNVELALTSSPSSHLDRVAAEWAARGGPELVHVVEDLGEALAEDGVTRQRVREAVNPHYPPDYKLACLELARVERSAEKFSTIAGALRGEFDRAAEGAPLIGEGNHPSSPGRGQVWAELFEDFEL